MNGRDTPEHCRDGDDEVDTSHLEDVEEGCGCTEVWEHLSEARQRDREESQSGEA